MPKAAIRYDFGSKISNQARRYVGKITIVKVFGFYLSLIKRSFNYCS